MSSPSVEHSVQFAPTAPTSPPDRSFTPWLALIAVVLGQFMVGLDGSVVSSVNPEIGRDLNASNAGLQWVTNAYLLAVAATLILGGKLGDRFGRRVIYITGVAGFIAASIAIGLSRTIDEVIFFRVVQGFFGALIMPNTLGLLWDVFPRNKLGVAVGVWAMVSSASVPLGPVLGGLLVENATWQSVFWINGLIGAFALVASVLALPRSKNPDRGQRFDVPGVLLLALGLVVLVFGVVNGATWGWGAGGTVGCIAGGLAVLLFFGWYETRVSHPLVPMRLLRSPTLTSGTLVTAINVFVLLGTLFLVMLYLQNVRGYTPLEAGWRMMPLSVASIGASPLGATVTERFGARLTLPLGMLLEAGASFGLLGLDVDSSYAAMWPSFTALGLGVGMVTASGGAVVGSVPVKDAGVAGGVLTTALQMGGALGGSVLVSLIGSRVGSGLAGELTSAGVPGPVASGLAGAKDSVALGVWPLSPHMTAQVKAAVIEGSGHAFMNGVHTAASVAGVLCVVGAVVAVIGVRPNASAATSG
ncbi:MFS transporter [Streptomyces glomeratus]|uniref:MFS transporter n=1 Tax=Streptomyces glomeratus TaxID=284452 RepID=A0ABP6M549_9ACTN|nr:MFS transporter [Streptomyces glomeratus]MCF1510452.1 MFS transporter [Streptomyces glomeratus]